MSLIDKPALFKQNQFEEPILVTIVDSFVIKECQYKLIVMDADGKLYQTDIRDITMITTQDEWQSDCDEIADIIFANGC